MAMLHASTHDGVLAYEVHGENQPVLFIHGGLDPDWFRPVAALAGGIRYHRAGYGESGPMAGSVSVARMAAHAYQLLRHLGIESAHVVGNSSGGNIALRLALDRPQAVRSLVLLEPALLAVPSGAFAPEAIERFRSGDAAGAADLWMKGIGGSGFRGAARDAETFFGQELPALRDFPFGPDEAARIAAPVLAVLGGDSPRINADRQDLLVSWLPNVQPMVLPGVNHMMPLSAPARVAEAVTRFVAASGPPRC